LNKKQILGELYKKGLIRTWYKEKNNGWTLISGLWSPFYIQLRILPSYPKLLNEIGLLIGNQIKHKGTKLLGIAMAGIPIASSISLSCNIPYCYSRKIAGVKNIADLKKYANEYGEHSLVEGIIRDGDEFIAVDDIVTKFDSKLVAIQQLKLESKNKNMAVKCEHVAVVIDRQQGAEAVAKQNGIQLHSLIKFKDELKTIKSLMAEKEYKIINDYLNDSKKYQNHDDRKILLSNIS
jgi:orotate phosphoribosyltransferase